QRFIGLVDRLELLLGALFLADVRVVFARQPAVGGLDLGLARAGLDAEDAVVVLEFHRCSMPRAAHGIIPPGGAVAVQALDCRSRRNEVRSCRFKSANAFPKRFCSTSTTACTGSTPTPCSRA